MLKPDKHSFRIPILIVNKIVDRQSIIKIKQIGTILYFVPAILFTLMNNNYQTKLLRMKKLFLTTCCLVIFSFTFSIADSSIVSTANEMLQTESQPQQSGSSVIGGILILVSIVIGYGTRKIYEIRSKNQEEIH